MLTRFARFSFIIFLLLAACQVQPLPTLVEEPAWRYADLRLVKAPGEQTAPETLAALYTRVVGADLQVRVDLLDFDPDPGFDLYLALDTRPGGTRQLPVAAQAGVDWDTLITIYASGAVTAKDNHYQEIPGLKLRVVLDAAQDSIVVSLDRAALGLSRMGFNLQAFVTAAGSQTIADSLVPVNSQTPNPQPAPVLLAFWNTFPATSPAQALRSWNGSHTGPFGGRHGLLNLLNAAHHSQVPLTLMDIKTPSSLSALDTIGGANLLHTLLRENLVWLPDVLPVESAEAGSLIQPPEWALKRLVNEGRTSAAVFQLPAEPYLYSPLLPPDLPADVLSPYQLLFTQSEESAQPAGSPQTCQRYQSWMVLNLPGGLATNLSAAEVKASQQATSDGLSLETRRSLLKLAAQNAASRAEISNPCSGKILLLGGNLAYSAWGEPFSAQASMDYIAGHPWIRVLRPEDLLGNQASQSWEEPALPVNQVTPVDTARVRLTSSTYIPHTAAGKPIPSGLSVAQLQADMLADLQTAPSGPLEDAAWQMYTSLMAPGFPLSPVYYPLRAEYLGQIGYWLAADRWAADPRQACAAGGQSSCAYSQDVNSDGEVEYILASPAYFGIFDRRGGYLAAAFEIDQSGPHQLVGPSWQFSVGQSDPSVWDASQGIAGDPAAERGAFSEIPAGYAGPPGNLTQSSSGRPS